MQTINFTEATARITAGNVVVTLQGPGERDGVLEPVAMLICDDKAADRLIAALQRRR